jgi:hypothetical protein
MKKTLPSSRVFGLALYLSLFGSIPALHAQIKSGNLPSTEGKNAIGDKELKAFAKAYVQFHKIRATYEPKLNGATSPQEKGQVDQEAVAKFGGKG